MMRIFLTGASGFIGSRILPALQTSGHQVIGLARSDATAQALEAAGVEVHRGTLDAPDSLLAGVERADAVIHTAFDHDFSRFAANCEKDRQAILTMGQALRGSERPLVITSGTLMGDDGSGAPARESCFNAAHPSPRTASELAGQQLLEAAVDVRVVRLPQVHDTVRQGLLTCYIERAVTSGAVALRGEGNNRWSAAHVDDVARLYVSALLQGAAGERYHAVAEEGIALREIAAVIARGLNLPLTQLDETQADAWFGWFAPFTALELRASSAWTRERLQWQPVGPGLLEDLRNMDYQKVTLSQ
ncbi:SDR family oxidoreductase [Klebsiella quasipneumoniae]|uniref:SDR family oxidoreductase n=1 Tax=Klebsiella quasipneumoniae TaxID=1463165 RepID=UPI0028F7DD51|nr:SDR family oxidoreductase [Klebsiella quasipneumoniae]MDT9740816.1 SDR family oxidoreductase [Klebsiella quasipneumoniae]